MTLPYLHSNSYLSLRQTYLTSLFKFTFTFTVRHTTLVTPTIARYHYLYRTTHRLLSSPSLWPTNLLSKSIKSNFFRCAFKRLVISCFACVVINDNPISCLAIIFTSQRTHSIHIYLYTFK